MSFFLLQLKIFIYLNKIKYCKIVLFKLSKLICKYLTTIILLKNNLINIINLKLSTPRVTLVYSSHTHTHTHIHTYTCIHIYNPHIHITICDYITLFLMNSMEKSLSTMYWAIYGYSPPELAKIIIPQIAIVVCACSI